LYERKQLSTKQLWLTAVQQLFCWLFKSCSVIGWLYVAESACKNSRPTAVKQLFNRSTVTPIGLPSRLQALSAQEDVLFNQPLPKEL